MKTFTLDEAQSLLPVVESLLERATRARVEAQRLDEKMAALKVRIFHSGGLAVNVVAAFRDSAELVRHREAVTEVMEEFASIGVEVKDLDKGLLDFPCIVEGELVLLCWQRGESRIEYWHTKDAGFAGRQKLDSRFRRNSRIDRPN
jgi:hypothetical protein